MWGTDENWMRVGLHFSLECDKHIKHRTIVFIHKNQDQRSYAKKIMEENGIWEQAQQIAREMDLNIEP